MHTWMMVGLLMAYSSGPPNATTGAPGEGLCTACHGGGTTNDGTLTLVLPSTLVSGDTVDVTVVLTDGDARRWGFELTVIDDQGNRAGEMLVSDPANTQLASTATRDYLKHTSAGTYPGQLNQASWTFRWVVPAQSSATFHVAGNAANNNAMPSGDGIYAISVPVTITSVAEGRHPNVVSPIRVIPGGIQATRSAILVVLNATGQRVNAVTLRSGERLLLNKGVYVLQVVSKRAPQRVRIFVP